MKILLIFTMYNSPEKSGSPNDLWHFGFDNNFLFESLSDVMSGQLEYFAATGKICVTMENYNFVNRKWTRSF